MKTMAQNTTFQHTKLADLRKAKKVTQEEFADAIRPDVKAISRELIKDFEIGSRIPKIDVVVAFAKYFEVSTDYLFGLTETPTQDTDIRMISDYTGLSEKVIERLHELYADSQDSESDFWVRDNTTDEMLWELIKPGNFCLTLSLPIIQMAQRKAAYDIAEQIIENPNRLVAKTEKAKILLQEINDCISSSTYKIFGTDEEERIFQERAQYAWLLGGIVYLLERNVPNNISSDEFDRFQAPQQYI